MAHTMFRVRIPRVLDTEQISEVKRKLLLLMPKDGEIDTEVVAPKFTYEIRRDTDPADPRRENDNVGVLVLKHSRYTLGDAGAELPFVDWRTGELRDDIYLCLEVRGYDHGGLTISHSNSGQFADQFDSGRLGWHYVTKQAVQDSWPSLDLGSIELRDAVERCLQAELKTYDAYLQGDVYGFVITDEEGEEVDACWGFVGDDIETNGILDHVGAEHHDGLRQAWKERT